MNKTASPSYETTCHNVIRRLKCAPIPVKSFARRAIIMQEFTLTDCWSIWRLELNLAKKTRKKHTDPTTLTPSAPPFLWVKITWRSGARALSRDTTVFALFVDPTIQNGWGRHVFRRNCYKMHLNKFFITLGYFKDVHIILSIFICYIFCHCLTSRLRYLTRNIQAFPNKWLPCCAKRLENTPSLISRPPLFWYPSMIT